MHRMMRAKYRDSWRAIIEATGQYVDYAEHLEYLLELTEIDLRCKTKEYDCLHEALQREIGDFCIVVLPNNEYVVKQAPATAPDNEQE